MLVNVIKAGSWVVKTPFSYMVRNHIQLPDSKVQKWSNEYILFYTNDSVVEKISDNFNPRQFYTFDCDIKVDVHGVRYMSLHETDLHVTTRYHLTTIRCVDVLMHRDNINSKCADSESNLFSLAYNKHNPKIFEATLLLQKGDVVRIGNTVAVFCPSNNPFLEKRTIITKI